MIRCFHLTINSITLTKMASVRNPPKGERVCERQELKSFPANRNNYQCRINEAIANDYASDTLLQFLRTLLPNIKDKQLPILMMCNMITGLYTKMPTPLQVALATVIKEKERIQELNQFGVLCTYDEVLRFRRSAAHASKRHTNRGLTPSARQGGGFGSSYCRQF